MREANYNIVLFPRYLYANCPCSDQYNNTNFDAILREIGYHYFHRPDLGVNGVCSLIKDEINNEWHLNGLKKSIRLKRVTTNQVKSIRRSFNSVKDKNLLYVRLPFNIVSIIYFIMSLVSQIQDDSSIARHCIQEMNRTNIGEYLYAYHISAFEEKYVKINGHLSDQELCAKYDELHARLTGFNTIMTNTFKDIPWNSLNAYIIK